MADHGFVGKVLDDRYRVDARLGAGAMATVYIARQESLDRDVVVKVPDPAFFEDQDFLARFQQEIRSLTKLRHPHIVAILEAGEIDGIPYAVMDYLEGQSLKHRMGLVREEGRREDPAEICRWLGPISQALDFIHARGVVHRDVKPGNILFDAYGNPFLSDFGIAKALGTADLGMTRTGTTVGTALYMAPEQGLPDPITGAADQYALGVILYEILTGAVPFRGETSPLIMVKKLTEVPEPLGLLVPELPPEAAASVMRALEREAEDRFPSCSAFAEAFKEALSGRGVPDAFEAETGELDRAPPVALEATTGTFEERVAEIPEVPEEVIVRPRTRPWLLWALLGVLVALGGVYLDRRSEPTVGVDTPPAQRLILEEAPEPGALTAEARIRVAGRIEGGEGAGVELGDRRFDLDGEGRFVAFADLSEGRNEIPLRCLDSGGQVVASWTFRVTLDSRAPVVTLAALPTLTAEARLVVEGTVDEEGCRVTVNGKPAEVTGLAYECEVDLAGGATEIVATAEDAAGNRGAARATVTRDESPPEVQLDALPGTTGSARLTVSGTVSEEGCRVTVNGSAAEVTEFRFEGAVELAPGATSIVVVAEDRVGNRGTARATVVLDDRPPEVRLAALPAVTREARLTVRGTVSEEGCRVTVNGTPARVEGTTFSCEIELSPGANAIDASAEDPVGRRGGAEAAVTLDDRPPVVRILPLATETDRPGVKVTGTVDEPDCRVTVNGIPARVKGLEFWGEAALDPGPNTITVEAEDRVGNRGAAKVRITLARRPPVVRIEPLVEVTSHPRIKVVGSVDKPGCRVTVNGTSARVKGLTFVCEVALSPGPNTITVTALDRAGQRGFAKALVTLDAAPLEIRLAGVPRTTGKPLLKVRGKVNKPGCRVTVNGSPAAVEGLHFEGEVRLTPGANSIEVVAEDRAGNRDVVKAVVVLDNRPPAVRIDALPPFADGARIRVTGSLSEDGCRVTVNGTAAKVVGRTYFCDLIVKAGTIAVEVVARNPAGLMGTARVALTRKTDLGTGYRYSRATREACRRLSARSGWRTAIPSRNARGMLEMVHERTGLTFVVVPAGSLRMGAEPREKGWSIDEGPQRAVRIPAFLLAKTECTQAAWDRVGGADDREWRSPDLPIEGVTWKVATAWCRAGGLRLPTEAEWEYACRAGSTSRWGHGDDESRLADHAWFEGNSGGKTHPVMRKQPNAWGFHDLHGNVYEWCEDTWHASYAGAPVDGSAWTTGATKLRVYRGGCWGSSAAGCRSAERIAWVPSRRSSSVGFRPAVSLPR